MEVYERWLKENGKSNTTITNYKVTVSAFQSWFMQHTKETYFDPQHVTALELQEWKNYMLNEATYIKGLDEEGKPNLPKRYSVSSVRTFVKELKSYFQFLSETRVINRNPAEKVRPPKVQNDYEEEPRWMTRRERSLLLNFIEDPRAKEKNHWRYARNKAVLFCGLHAGLRVSEIANLQIDDLSFEKSSLNVLGKGGKTRWVPMNLDLKKALREWIEARGEHESPYLFISQEKTKLSAQAIWYLCKQIEMRAPIKNFTPHVLRHTFGHDLAEKGYRLEYIADLLGHSNLNFTRVYTRPSKADKRRAVESLSEERTDDL